MESLQSLKIKIHKFFELSYTEQQYFLLFSLYFILFLLIYRFKDYKESKKIIDKLIHKSINSNVINNKISVYNLSKIINLSLTNSYFKSNCLQQSLFSFLILGLYGQKSEIKFGISNPKEFQAHAWVECCGLIVNDKTENINNITKFGKL